MFGLEKQLRAAQKFLDGVKNLPRYPELEGKQVSGLLMAVSKSTKLTVVQAGVLLNLLEQGGFSESSVEKLKSAIAEKTTAGDTDPKRKSMQDYTMFPYYLSEQVWVKVLDQNVDRGHVLDVLCLYVGLLGLRRPTELTMSALVTLAYRDRMSKMNKKDQHQLLQSKKVAVKKALASLLEPAVQLEQLPQQRDDLPEVLRDQTCAEYGPAVDPKIPVHDLYALVNAVPLRRSHSELVAEDKHEQNALSLGQAFAQCFQALGSGQALASASSGVPRVEPRQLALCDISREDAHKQKREDLSSQGNKLQERKEDTVSDVVRNTEPIVVDTETDGFSTAPVKPAAKGAVSLAESLTISRGQGSRDTAGKQVSAESLSLKLATLKQDLSPDEEMSSAGTVKRPAAKLKRPAAPMKCSGKGKRPASALENHQHSGNGSGRKRDRVSGLSGKPESRSERKQRLLSTIPPAERKKFKTGCAKCRFATDCTPSCWKERGYSLED